MENILTLEEAARYLKVAPITLYRKARRGEVPAAKMGKSWRFHRGQLEEWIKNSAALSHPSLNSSPEAFRHLSTRETNLVLQFIEILKSRYPRLLEGVVLYGSKARGDFQDSSEIDLLVALTVDSEETKNEINKIVSHFNVENDVTLKMLVVSRSDYFRIV